HDYIAPFCGAANLGNRLAIISPFMHHGSLLQYLGKNPRTDRKVQVLQVADAVYYLHHSLKIIHGDLKCENVLISDAGNALLTDFGLSTWIDKGDSEETTATDIRGWHTVRFAAPELLIDEAISAGRTRSKTPESDVYAFGMLVLQVGAAAFLPRC
ncbi:kinase-like protein, partial [Auricularia subglabra TFB-10046 SS5]